MQVSSILKPSVFFNYLKLIRVVNLLMVGLTQYLTAIFLVTDAAHWTVIFKDKGFFLLVSSTIMITSAGYLINDYYDIKIDMVNKPNRVLIGTKLRRRWALAGHTALNLGAITIGFLLSPTIGIINFGAAFLLWLYSNQLKRLPFIGNLAIALLTGTTLVLVGEYFEAQQYLIFCYAVFAAFITIIREIIKDMEDLKGDERFGCKTLPIVYGIAKTKNILYVICILFLVTVFFMIKSVSIAVPITLFVSLIFLIFGIQKADTTKSFSQLSTITKLIMLLGIISMAFI